VRRLLDDQGFGVHANPKPVAGRAAHPARDRQVRSIAHQRQRLPVAGRPPVSVDRKQQEVVGPCKHGGRAWRRVAEAVTMYDFRSDALGRAAPDGIDDRTHQRGSVCLGQSADTRRCAGEARRRWWLRAGRAAVAGARDIRIVAEAGGRHRARSGVGKQHWKQQRPQQCCEGLGLTVTVSP